MKNVYPGLRKTLLPKFDSIAAGAFGISTLTTGIGYHVARIDASDDRGAEIEDIIDSVELLVGGNPQREAMTPAMINAINSSRASQLAKITSGAPGAAGYKTMLPIWFCEPDRMTPGAVTAGVLHNNGAGDVQIKVKVNAAAVNPVVDLWGEWEPSDKPLGVLTKWSLETPPISGDVMELINLHIKKPGDLIQSMHWFPTASGKYVSALRVKVNGEEVRDTLTQFRNQCALMGRGMAPDTGAAPRFDFVIDYDDPILRALVVRSEITKWEIRATLNAAAADSMSLVTVHVGPPE